MEKKIRWACLASGGGSTFEAMVGAVRTGLVQGIEPALLVYSKTGIGAIQKAGTLRIESVLVPAAGVESGLLEILRNKQIDLVTQNGWLVRTPNSVVDEYRGRIFNQHPGHTELAGGQGMYGLRVHAAMCLWSWFNPVIRDTYAVVQRVGSNYDSGEVVDWESLPIGNRDDVLGLAQRLLPIEHRLNIRLLQKYVDETVNGKPLPDFVYDPRVRDCIHRLAIAKYPKG